MASKANKIAEGHFTYFQLNPAYRECFEDSFTYSTDDNTLAAFVERDTAYVVMVSDGAPALCKRDNERIGERPNQSIVDSVRNIKEAG